MNAGINPPLWFFRTGDRKEVDLLLERTGVLYPVEVKKSALPVRADVKSFRALDAVAREDVPPELAAFKREVGAGAVVCLSSDTFPVSSRAWAFPVWAI